MKRSLFYTILTLSSVVISFFSEYPIAFTFTKILLEGNFSIGFYT